MSKAPGTKDIDAAPPATARPAWLLWLVGAGLVLVGAGVALAIALPLTLRKSGSSMMSSSPTDSDVLLANQKGSTRSYFLAAEPVQWDYAPSGRNLCKDEPFTEEQAAKVNGGIGRVYTKAVFRQYVDGAFKDRVARTPDQQHMGLLGPAMYAEAGDTIEVTLRNLMNFTVNIEPSGLQYSSPVVLRPRETLTYRWRVPASAAPAPGDASSKLWMYRSTADVAGHTQAGLAGPIVITRKGELAPNGKRPADVDRELFLDLQVFDESGSPLYGINSAPHKKALAELEEDELTDTLTKHTINGFIHCNIPGLNMTTGERVRWYVMSLGNEDALHTAHWHGISLNMDGRHMDQVVVQSSSLMVLDAYTDNPGTWLFHCHLTDHMEGGMMALFTVSGERPAQPPANGKTRTYYIAAEEKVWDYAPFGGEMCGGTLVNFTDGAKTFLESGPDRIGRKYLKALYVEYEDATFTAVKRRPPQWEHLGLMGPIIRGTVGDTIQVVFKNKLKASNNTVSIHPHGVFYDKNSEGSPYADGLPVAAADAVAPGDTVTYNWTVLPRSGPGPKDFSSVMWMYHSHVSESGDPYAGLFGAIIITSPEAANEDASPKDVDREYVLTFAIMDESDNIMTDFNLVKYLPEVNATALKKNSSYQEASKKHSINGYMYCNLPGLDFNQGAETRLYFMAFGGSKDMHTPNSAESQLYLDGQRKQAVRVLPGGMLTADVTPMAPGKGILQCHVYDHIAAGMSALYNVKNLKAAEVAPGATRRTYYIAAEPETWDYTPLGYDGCTGQPFSGKQRVFTVPTKNTMGSIYKKGRFVQYTDASFSKKVPTPAVYGTLGPLLKAEVGDILEVHFMNKLLVNSSFQAFGGLVPIGKSSAYQVGLASGSNRRLSRRLAQAGEAEAAITQSVENLYALNAVAPGGKTTYQWLVPESAVGPQDAGSALYAYVSGVDHIKHINAGLVGPMVVMEKGGLGKQQPALEVPLMFNVQNELQSFYLNDSIALQEKAYKLKFNRSAENFAESNVMHSLNGYIYCNMPSVEVPLGSTVRFYILSFGTETGLHSPVFPGQQVTNAGSPVWSVGMMPATTSIIDVQATSAGAWVFYCNVLDHVQAGMQGRMVVS